MIHHVSGEAHDERDAGQASEAPSAPRFRRLLLVCIGVQCKSKDRPDDLPDMQHVEQCLTKSMMVDVSNVCPCTYEATQ